jgi:methylenetetrahydrofolate reductase-like protein
VNHDPLGIRDALERLIALRMENVFAITGDWPKGAAPEAVQFAGDSVQLVETIHEVRETRRWPFYISVAVSPFKYTEADCAYQYLKLEKKIAAGADFAITQLGFDSRKLRELKRYLDDRGLRTPILGSVYVLPPKAAERMSKGEPPGCWVSPELLAKIQGEAKAEDKGLAARLERAATMAAIVRGLGYAGAYIGGTHNADHIRWIIGRAEGRRFLFLRFADAAAQAARVHAEALRCHRARQHSGPFAHGVDGHPALDRPAPRCCTCFGKGRVGFQEAGLWMPGVRQLRSGVDGVRLPDDVPEEHAQRALRRHFQRPVRGDPRAGLHLGGGLPARQICPPCG